MKPMYHRGGPVPCNKPALLVVQEPDRYTLAADNVRLLDGTKPKRGDAMICGSCDQPIVSQWLFKSPEREIWLA